MSLQLRYYQKKAIDDFFNFTANNHGKHPLVVVPTGGGKTILIAEIVKKIILYKDTRVLLVTHQSELLKQAYITMTDLFRDFIDPMDIGIYSAGLKCKDTNKRITLAGIQSVHNKAWSAIGFKDLILVDECHRINPKNEGTYRKFLHEMEKINPNVVIGGLTATHYRMKSGLLTEGKDALFDHVCHETSIKELIDPNDYRNTDKKQYLSKIISKNGVEKVDLSNVHVRSGDYKQDEMEHAFMENDLVEKAVKEISEYTLNRKKVLIFTSGIKHCKEVYNSMMKHDSKIAMVHSKQSKEINDKNIKDFKNGTIKYLLNINSMTEGFDDKEIDCVVLLRSTKSPGLYYQMVGRALRIHPDKENCLVLDYGLNIQRMGPIDKIEIKKTEKGKRPTGAPQKECPVCHSVVHLSIMKCPDCGYEFPEGEKHEEKASEEEILSTWKKPKTVDVKNVIYSKHEKIGKTPSMKVSYYYDLYSSYNEWICLDHIGFAQRKAASWIKERTDEDIQTVDEAIKYFNSKNNFKEAVKIIVDVNDKFPKITGYILEEKEKSDGHKQDSTYDNKSTDEKLMELLF